MLYSLKPKFYHSNIDIPELLGYNFKITCEKIMYIFLNALTT